MIFEPEASVLSALIGAAFTGAVWGVSSYLTEKGRNRATREDIAAITAAAESIKSTHAAAIDRDRHLLAQAQNVSARQLELEIEAYRAVWKSLIQVHRASLALRPALDWTKQGESKEERQRARLQEFADTFNPYINAVWEYRPFYPSEVFAELEILTKLMRAEALEYQHRDPTEDRAYWKKAMENADKIAAQTVKICDTIRTRLSVARVA